MKATEWEDTVQRIKNNPTNRQINKLFRANEAETEHFFPDYDAPTFYPSVKDIPPSMPGIYFLWQDIHLDYIGMSAACIHNAIKRSKIYRPDMHIISATHIWDWHECSTIRQFLIAILNPDKNSYAPPKKPGKQALTYSLFEERFWAKVEPRDGSKWDGGCRLWLGNVNNRGYGRVRAYGKLRLAHRVAYELAEGSIPAGAKVLHTCGNRLCCNPIHLRLRLPKG